MSRPERDTVIICTKLLAGLKDTCNKETSRADLTILCDGSCHQVSLLSLLQSLINITTLLWLSLCCSFQHWDLILPFICWIRSCLELDVFPQSVNYDWMLSLEVSSSVPSLPKQRFWSWVSKQTLPSSAGIFYACRDGTLLCWWKARVAKWAKHANAAQPSWLLPDPMSKTLV